MSDTMTLIERLRTLEGSDDLGNGYFTVCHEAADEIERLNTALKYEENRLGRIVSHGPGCHTWGPQHYECLLRKSAADGEALSTISGLASAGNHDIAQSAARGILQRIEAIADKTGEPT